MGAVNAPHIGLQRNPQVKLKAKRKSAFLIIFGIQFLERMIKNIGFLKLGIFSAAAF